MPHRSSVPMKWRLSRKVYPLFGSGSGVVVSFTVIRNAPAGFDTYAPYVVGIIELDNGSKITGQVVGPVENIKIGSRVRPVFRKLCENGLGGLIEYTTKYEVI